MGLKSEILGEPIDLPLATSRMVFDHSAHNIRPGIVQIDNNGSGSQLVGIKHSSFRPEAGEDGKYYQSDVVALSTAVYDNNPSAMGPDRLQGLEAELNIVDKDGDPLNLYSSALSLSDGLSKEVHKHPELWDNTLEIDASPKNTTWAAYTGLKKVILAANKDLGEINGFIDPASARMQDVPGEHNVTNNPYVRVMVSKLGKDIMKFIGLGIHEHYDVHTKHSPIVGNYLRPLAPFLNIGLHAAPFGFGEVTPNLRDIFSNDELRSYDGQQPSSLRYIARAYASPDGGVGTRVAHDNIYGALSHANNKMNLGEINSPARLYGNHADIRLRSDPPTSDKPNHPGRVELCVSDTGAYRVETNLAYSTITRAIVNRLEKAAVGGRRAMLGLHTEFSSLFGNTYDMDEFAKVQLDRAHENSIRMAYHGVNSLIVDGNGKEIPARIQLERIIDFANGSTRNRLSASTIEQIKRSVVSHEKLDTAMKQHLDQDRLPTLDGYYKSGLGNAAQWMVARANAQKDRGLTESTIMQDNTLDRVRSFKKYLARRGQYGLYKI